MRKRVEIMKEMWSEGENTQLQLKEKKKSWKISKSFPKWGK